MATVGETITRALQIAKVIGIGGEANADEADYCLDAYNEMMAAWEIDGLNLAHLTAALTDTVDVPDSHLEAIRLSLAERVAPAFGADLSPDDKSRAERGRMALRAYHFSLADLSSENPLSRSNLASDE